MTESEMIARAKMYMEKLAHGIDPLTDSSLKADECASNPRMRKCFAYTAEILEKAYEATLRREASEKRRRLEDFALDHGAVGAFPYSDEPIGVSEICRRFNSLIDAEKNRKLKTTSVTAFLITSGLIEKNGKVTRPTAAGVEMGIEVLNKINVRDGQPYEQVVYPISVQRFLVDNIDALCAYNRERAARTAANRGE